MDNLSRISIFTAVVRQESFAGAARELGITSSAVSKQIQNLEFELKTKLLNRTTRKVSVTEEGAIFFERASRALEDIKEATEQINELKATPRGPLRISVPMSFGLSHLTKPIAEFAKLYPDVSLDLQFDDRVVDMVEEGFDVSIRIGALKDSTMIARKLAPCPIYVCASQDYLETHGEPKTAANLADHNVLAFTRNRVAHEWRYKDQNGKEGMISLHSNFKCDTGEMMVEAARQGVGIAILPAFFVLEDLKSGRLKMILQDHVTWPARGVFAMFPANRYLSTRVRLFVDYIDSYCSQILCPAHLETYGKDLPH